MKTSSRKEDDKAKKTTSKSSDTSKGSVRNESSKVSVRNETSKASVRNEAGKESSRMKKSSVEGKSDGKKKSSKKEASPKIEASPKGNKAKSEKEKSKSLQRKDSDAKTKSSSKTNLSNIEENERIHEDGAENHKETASENVIEQTLEHSEEILNTKEGLAENGFNFDANLESAKVQDKELLHRDEGKLARSESVLERPKSAKPRSGDYKKREASSRARAAQEERDNRIKDEVRLENNEKSIKSDNENRNYKENKIENKLANENNLVSENEKEIKFENDKIVKEIKFENGPIRPKSSLRPPSVRPSSARPGAPRLRPESALPFKEVIPLGKIKVIVENYSDKEADDEETVVIQNVLELEPEPTGPVLELPADKGHLVEQILEQLHEQDILEQPKPNVDIDWEEGFRGKDATSREIAQLRNAIQAVTRTANPLGKLMNFLHEDLEAMQTELHMWMNMKRQIREEISKQKKYVLINIFKVYKFILFCLFPISVSL